MLKKVINRAAALLLACGLALAHGNATHLMGTVTAIGQDTVTIKDKEGKSVVVMLEKTTKYLKNKKPAASAEMKVGTRVVIDAQMDQKTKRYTAEEIQLGISETTTAGH